jgi:hypothetical protein
MVLFSTLWSRLMNNAKRMKVYAVYGGCVGLNALSFVAILYGQSTKWNSPWLPWILGLLSSPILMIMIFELALQIREKNFLWCKRRGEPKRIAIQVAVVWFVMMLSSVFWPSHDGFLPSSIRMAIACLVGAICGMFGNRIWYWMQKP